MIREELTMDDVKTIDNNAAPINETPGEEMPAAENQEKMFRKDFSAAGWRLALFSIAVQTVAIIISVILALIKKTGVTLPGYVSYFKTFICIHCVGLGSAILLFRLWGKDRNTKLPEKKLGFWNFVIIFMCVIGFSVPLAFLGNVPNIIISMLAGGDLLSGNVALQIASQGSSTLLGNIFLILFAVVFAPIVEELIFRKLLIDRVGKWGAIVSAIVSGLLFGLYHGNLSQVFYATFIGYVFATVYLRTGRIRYSIMMHMLVNGINSVLMIPILNIDINRLNTLLNEIIVLKTNEEIIDFLNGLSGADLSVIVSYFIFSIMALLYFCFIFVSLVLSFVFIKKVFIFEAPFKCPFKIGKALKNAFLNPGIIAFIILCLLDFASYYIGLFK